MPAQLEEVVVDPDPLQTPSTSANSEHRISSCGVRGAAAARTASDPAPAAHGGPACRSASAAADPAPPAQTAPCSPAAAADSAPRSAATSSAAPGRRHHVAHQPRAGPARPRAPPPPPAQHPPAATAPPRSRQARSGTRAASPARPTRPRNSSTPSERQRARSPVRYIRLPGRTIRVRDKPLRRQPKPPQIAPRNATTRNVKLPRNTRRNRLKTAVQNINPRVPDRTANRRRRRPSRISRRIRRRLQQHHRRPDRGLGRAVEIVTSRRCNAAPRQRTVRTPRRRPASASPHSMRRSRPHCRAAIAVCRSIVLHRAPATASASPAFTVAPLCADRAKQRRARSFTVSAAQPRPGAAEQRQVKLQRRDVEADRRQPPAAGRHARQRNLLLHRQQEVRQARHGAPPRLWVFRLILRCRSRRRPGSGAMATAGALRRLQRDGAPVGVEPDQPRRRAAPRHPAAAGERAPASRSSSACCVTSTRAAGVRQHERQPLRRIRRVERQIRRARLEDAEQADHHLQRAIDAAAPPPSRRPPRCARR